MTTRPNQQINYYHDLIEGQPEFITYELLAAGVSNHIFIATQPVRVVAISYIGRVIGSDGSAVSASVVRCQGVEAPASGDALQQAVFNLKATVETVQNATLTATAALLDLDAGDRLACLLAGTQTAVVGNITVTFYPIKRSTDTPA